jgi:ribosomal protein S18 acetylase RimI-like enzyme
MEIRAAAPADADAIWRILEPRIRAGETYPLPVDLTREDALGDWFAPGHDVFVAVNEGRVVGTYYMRANHIGNGSHVANCGYMTGSSIEHRGVGRAMCLHSLGEAKRRGFRAMQFNFVVSTNERAVRLWQSCGFEIVGRLPGAFRHPIHGYVDAFVMYQSLADR